MWLGLGHKSTLVKVTKGLLSRKAAKNRHITYQPTVFSVTMTLYCKGGHTISENVISNVQSAIYNQWRSQAKQKQLKVQRKYWDILLLRETFPISMYNPSLNSALKASKDLQLLTRC